MSCNCNFVVFCIIEFMSNNVFKERLVVPTYKCQAMLRTTTTVSR